MYVSAIHTCFSRGISTPAIRAISLALSLPLSLLLLGLGIGADNHHHATPLDHLALLAARLDRCRYLPAFSLSPLAATGAPALASRSPAPAPSRRGYSRPMIRPRV